MYLDVAPNQVVEINLIHYAFQVPMVLLAQNVDAVLVRPKGFFTLATIEHLDQVKLPN